jgi:hypothetical protein
VNAEGYKHCVPPGLFKLLLKTVFFISQMRLHEMFCLNNHINSWETIFRALGLGSAIEAKAMPDLKLIR